MIHLGLLFLASSNRAQIWALLTPHPKQKNPKRPRDIEKPNAATARRRGNPRPPDAPPRATKHAPRANTRPTKKTEKTHLRRGRGSLI